MEIIQSPESVIIMEKMKTAVENSMDGIALLDAEGKYYYLNDVHVKMFGYDDEEELLGQTWQFIYGPEEIDRINTSLFPLLMANGKWSGETIGKSKQGEPVHQDITLTALPDGGLICICRDISSRKKSKKQLDLMDRMVQSANSLVIITDKYKKIEWVNKAFEELTEYSLEEVIGKKPGDILQGKETDPEVISYMSKRLEKQQPLECETLNYSKSGKPYWISMKIQPLLDDCGKVEKYFAIEENITERKTTEQRLRIAEERLHLAVDAAHAGVWDWNLETNEVFYNDTGKKLHGNQQDGNIFPPEDFLSNDFIGDDKRNVMEAVSELISGSRESVKLTYRFRTPEGDIKWFDDTARVISRNAEGNATRIIGIFFNVTDNMNLQQRVSENERRWNFALEGSGYGVWDLNLTTGEVFFSKKLKELLGYREDELESSMEAWERIVHPEDHKNSLQEMARYFSNEIPQYENEQRALHKDGEWRWFLNRGYLSNRTPDGRPERFIGAVTDITNKKRIEQELIRAKDLAEASVRAKRRFLANISHEIRTPMHAIMGIGEQLSKSELDSKQKQQLAIINESAQFLLTLINDLLDISRIEEGKVRIDKAPFMLREAVNDTLNIIRGKAEEKGIHLIIKKHAQQDQDVCYLGDQNRIKQILLNILTNAIKFTDNGTVTFESKLLTHTKAHHTLEFIITDTGIGMSPEMLSRLFEEFSQEDESFIRKYGGSGLGLSITRQLVELMGGNIRIESEKNKGTCVTIVLPFDVTEKPVIRDNSADIKKMNTMVFSDIHILVAEDNRLNRLLLEIMLKDNGIRYDEAENGKMAVEMAAAKKYDLILMDIQMPEMDGMEATKIIRKELKQDIPIIAITANAIKEELELYLQNGINDTITKPFEETVLLQKLLQWLIL